MSIILTLARAVTEAVSLLSMVPLLDMIGVAEHSSMRQASKLLGWAFKALGMSPTLGSLRLLFASVAGLRVLLAHWQLSVSSGLREDVTANMRDRVYRAIARAEWKFVVTRRPSEFVNVLMNEIVYIGTAAYRAIAISAFPGGARQSSGTNFASCT